MARRKEVDKVQAALAVAALAQLDREKNAPAPPAAPPTDAETLQAVMTTPAPVEAPPAIVEAPNLQPAQAQSQAEPPPRRQPPLQPARQSASNQAPRPDPKLPPASQLTEPAPRPTPPQFLRDHAARIQSGTRDPRYNPPIASLAAVKAKDKPRGRFGLLAACVAIAATLGAIIGSVGAAGLQRYIPLAIAPDPAGPTKNNIADIRGLKDRIAQLTSELAAVKAGVDASRTAANAQFTKIAERLDKSDRAQADPAAKLAKIIETLDRMERRPMAAAAPPPAPLAAAPPTVAPPANDVTGSLNRPPAAEPPAPLKHPVIEGWVVRKVYDGVALLEGRMGIVEVEPGFTIPGAGRVEEIKKIDGKWVVLTSKGMIVSAR